MELEKFDPVCAAVLKKTEIEKPAYPVIDFHMSGNCKMPALYAL